MIFLFAYLCVIM